MSKVWIAIIVVLALATPASARMHHRVPHRVNIAAALDVAYAMWPQACSPVQLKQTQFDPAVRLSANAVLGGDPCVITLDASWPSWSQAFMCAVMVHEVGHLAGMGHSPDPANPMFATIHPIPQCPGLFRWEWYQWLDSSGKVR